MASATKTYLAIRKRVIRLIRGRFFVARRDSGRFLIDIHDHICRQIEAYGMYEKKQILHLHTLFEKHSGEKFLDIGTNLGMYSIYFAKKGVETHSFEPDSRIRHHLFANIFLNNLDDIINVYPVALSDKSGSLRFERFSDQNRGRSRVTEEGSFSVQAKQLDELLTWNGLNVCIKVDIEGHELAFLEGASNFLKNNACILQIEVLQSHEAVFSKLKALGYEKIDNIGQDYYFTKSQCQQ